MKRKNRLAYISAKMTRKKRRKYNPYFILLIAFLFLILIAAVVFKIAFSFMKAVEPPALSLKDFLAVEGIEVQSSNIFLTANCYRLAMTTNLEQTESIANALQNVTASRPNAHDLFVYSIKNFGISLIFVKITSFQEGAYYSKIFLREDNRILALDARPSDAIAIALRARTPVYINNSLLSNAERIC